MFEVGHGSLYLFTVIFMAYLIDKHNLWRKAAKIAVWILIFAAIGCGCFYGWFKYDEYQTEKRQEGENAAYEAKMKPIRDCAARNAQFSNAEEECEKDPSIILHSNEDVQPAAPEKRTRDTRPARFVKASNDVDLTTTELGRLVCGHMKAGEVATLLNTSDFGVKVRTTGGQVGWAWAGYFEVANTPD